jgi:hypothetical protein
MASTPCPTLQSPEELCAARALAVADEGALGWDFKVRKALEHASNLALIPLPLDPDLPADRLVAATEIRPLEPSAAVQEQQPCLAFLAGSCARCVFPHRQRHGPIQTSFAADRTSFSLSSHAQSQISRMQSLPTVVMIAVLLLLLSMLSLNIVADSKEELAALDPDHPGLG